MDETAVARTPPVGSWTHLSNRSRVGASFRATRVSIAARRSTPLTRTSARIPRIRSIASADHSGWRASTPMAPMRNARGWSPSPVCASASSTALRSGGSGTCSGHVLPAPSKSCTVECRMSQRV